MSERLIAIDAGALPWEEHFNEQVGRPLFRKNLMTDLEIGMKVRLVRYPAGFINPRHTHPCAHGMYVLDGILLTHDGAYGPLPLRLVSRRHGYGTRRHGLSGRGRAVHY